ncbi:MAG: CRISPR-associated endonuclease Cas2 [Rickettsiales bacterium]|nr:CRISPR-associated endonuclease Cas2 [Rickettsiales bacterium]
MIVFFDLPTLTKSDRRNATRFRNNLLNDGYYMMQWSVYSRICKGIADVEKHSQRLKYIIPPAGNVRLMSVTEKQFAEMEILIGTPPKPERIGPTQLLLF